MAITHARITNNNDFPIHDRYDGVPIILEPGVPVRVSVAAAVLFFDMPVDFDGNVTWRVDANSWATFSRRQGWTNLEPEKGETINLTFQRVTKQASEWCSKIKVEPVSMVLREVTEEEQLLAPPREGSDGAETPSAEGERPARPRRGGVATVS